MKDNFEVDLSEVLQVRDIDVGDLYIYRRDFKRYQADSKWLYRFVRVREPDAFLAKTLMGSVVHEYPSEKVYRVRRTNSDSA